MISKKLPHIHDSLRFYNKYINKKYDVTEDNKRAINSGDYTYNILSQICHPNPLGTIHLYSYPTENYEKGEIVYDFSIDTIKQFLIHAVDNSLIFTFDFLDNIVEVRKKYSNYFLNSKKFSFDIRHSR